MSNLLTQNTATLNLKYPELRQGEADARTEPLRIGYSSIQVMADALVRRAAGAWCRGVAPAVEPAGWPTSRSTT